jgi:sugar phosphate isomerase/epimerase
MMSFQYQLGQLLNPSGHEVVGIPIPTLNTSLARKLLERIQSMAWYLNRYSLELNFKHGQLTVEEMMDMARAWGFDGVQLHIANDDPRVSLSRESDAALAELAAQRDRKRLDIQLEISSTENSDIDDTVRVARAMGAKFIRCYIRGSGTLTEIIDRAVVQLDYAAELAECWQLDILLEQHEFLTGPEMVHIIERVGSPRLGILFDFANPISARRRPLEDLQAMQSHVRSAHCKDARIIEHEGTPAQLGVAMGQGDLNLHKLLFDLLLLGEDRARVPFFAIQMTLDYLAVSLRAPSDDAATRYEQREPSQTVLAAGLADLEPRLAQERIVAEDGFAVAKSVVAELEAVAEGFLAQESSAGD